MRNLWRALASGCVIVASVACGGGREVAQGPRAKPKHRFTAQPAEKWMTVEDVSGMDPTVMPFDPTHAAGTASQLTARFAGEHRAGAKTSIADGARIQEFASVAALQTSLPTDDQMRKHHVPRITKETMDRVSEEQSNVGVKAWIYAIKYETDNDWHLITGTDPADGDPTYFNAEVSGLPKKQDGQEAPSFEALLGVRKSLAEILDDNLPRSGSYHQYDPPIAVTIEGSVFYDIDHLPGVVGPESPRMKPTTSWEIHPITSLTER